jgi:hypothetical protein
LLPLLLVDALSKQFVLCYLAKRLHDQIIKTLGLLYKNFLDIEEVPVFANREQQIVKEVVESIPEVVPDIDNVGT